MDQISRNRIVSEINENFFTEAGAGSGKTTMLVRRMVAMVEQGIDIRKICAITFTKPAAEEFYERFHQMLIERSNPNVEYISRGHAGELPTPTEKTRQYCFEALKNIDLCFMGTIDAFCRTILLEHPREAEIPSDSTIIEESELIALCNRVYVQICDGEYGERLKELARSFQAVHRDAERVFSESILFFLHHKDVRFVFDPIDLSNLDELLENTRKETIKLLGYLKKNSSSKYVGSQKSRDAWEKLGVAIRASRTVWSSNFSNVLWALQSISEIAVNCEPGAADPVIEKYFQKIYRKSAAQVKWESILDVLNEVKYRISMAFLTDAAGVIDEKLRTGGYQTFADNLIRLRNMLRNDAEKEGRLIRYIFSRHSYFLIDEFQDTNPIQAEIFFLLTAENINSRWYECKPVKGSLFVVGDPKQSIYRFRDADVTSYMRVKKLFEDGAGDVLKLTRNFRSTKTLCRYFNDIFSINLPEETGIQSKFEDIPLDDKLDDDETLFGGVYTYNCVLGKARSEYPEECDEVMAGRIIQTIVSNPQFKIKDPETGEPREIRYADIMIIPAAKGIIANYISHFSLAGIPLKVEGKVPFESVEALQAVYEVFSAIAYPNDRLRAYAAMTGVINGITEPELALYQRFGYAMNLSSAKKLQETESNPHVVKVGRKVNKLLDLYTEAKHMSPSAVFSMIMDRYRIFDIVKTEHLEVIYYTLELLREAQQKGAVISLKDGADFIRALVQGESDEDRCLSLEAAQNRVHIANLHKVKGLEAPVVILAYSYPISPKASHHIRYAPDETTGYLQSFSAGGFNSAVHFSTNAFKNQMADEIRILFSEDMRKKYVAATRARNALIISKSYQRSRNGFILKTMWESLLPYRDADFFKKFKDRRIPLKSEFVSVPAGQLYEKANEQSVFNDRSGENETYHNLSPSSLILPSKLREGETEDSVQLSGQLIAEGEREDSVQLSGQLIAEGETEDSVQLSGQLIAEGETEDSVQLSGQLILEEDAGISTSSAYPHIHLYASIFGTMVHKLMEYLVISRSCEDLHGLVNGILSEYLTEEADVYHDEFKDALLEIASTMLSGGYPQTNGVPQDLLGELFSADEVQCEVPYSYLDHSESVPVIWSGIMDVVYCKDGQWHIIDYKTNADGRHLDQVYDNQLSAYKTAFKEIAGTEADAHTYHIGLSRGRVP